VLGPRAMVATPHYLASAAGLRVLHAGGNAVSMLQSLYFDFGSGIVAGDTGVLLQNRGSFFSLDQEHVNRLEPRKRTFHTLIPAMLLLQGHLFLVYGTMGGEGQPQTQAALVSRIVDFGYEVQAAIEAPRWLYGSWGMATRDLFLEGRIASSIMQELARRGHPVRVVAPWDELLGHAQAIRIDPATGYARAARIHAAMAWLWAISAHPRLTPHPTAKSPSASASISNCLDECLTGVTIEHGRNLCREIV
jgi:gamma-glutamyltranspeptidase